MEERLWDYIDGHGSPEERGFIAQLIATNAEWRAKYNELLDVHTLMNDHLELDEPSLRFTQNVMDEIGKHQIAPAAKAYINKHIIRGIGAFFLCSIIGLLVFIFARLNWTANTDIDLSTLYNSAYMNVFIMINTVLGLALLDMYLSRKKARKNAG